MRSFDDSNPIPVFVWYAAVIVSAMFCMNPVILLLCLLGALSFSLMRNGVNSGKRIIFISAVFLVTALINPLFSHNGVTVLFVMNDNPVTLEALLYGVFSAVMIISVLLWFRSFSQIMTSDRLLCLFGAFSPKLALLLSVTLRYIPLFEEQTKKVNQAQRALGLWKEDNAIDGIRSGSRVFSVMVTWGLENGIVTADSMAARGYGTEKRTNFSLYRFGKSDLALLLLTLFLFAATIFGIGSGELDFDFYPRLDGISASFVSFAAYISYGILVFIPTFTEAKEKIKWKYLRSKI